MKIELSEAKAIIISMMSRFNGPARRIHFRLVRNDEYFAAAALKKWPILLGMPVAIFAALLQVKKVDSEIFNFISLLLPIVPIAYFLMDSHFEAKQAKRRIELKAKRLQDIALLKNRQA